MRHLGPWVEGLLEPAVFGLSRVKEKRHVISWMWAAPTTEPSLYIVGSQQLLVGH